MPDAIFWNGVPLDYLEGETVASTLQRHRKTFFGTSASGREGGVFCAIGQCQNCLVRLESGRLVEACLTVCVPDLQVFHVHTASQEGSGND